MNMFFTYTFILLFLTISYSSAWPSWGGDGGNGNNGNDYYPWQKTTKSPDEMAKCGTNILGNISLDFNGTREALVGEIPWQVSVQIKKDWSTWSHGCGGVVIAKDHVLTSAKCVSGAFSGSVRVEAGSIDLPKGGPVRRRRQAPAYPGQDTPGLKYVQRTFVHPDYDKTTQENDIAILRLAAPFDIDKAEGKINEICLPKTKPIRIDEQLLLAGWGSNRVNATLRPKLGIVKVDLETTHCNQTKSACFVQNILSDEDDCEGDFGGAIFSYDQESKTSSLVGIYSRGDDCSQDNPAVYDPIEPYIDWIKKNSEDSQGGGSGGSGWGQ